jgi:hypothetical protein
MPGRNCNAGAIAYQQLKLNAGAGLSVAMKSAEATLLRLSDNFVTERNMRVGETLSLWERSAREARRVRV